MLRESRLEGEVTPNKTSILKPIMDDPGFRRPNWAWSSWPRRQTATRNMLLGFRRPKTAVGAIPIKGHWFMAMSRTCLCFFLVVCVGGLCFGLLCFCFFFL